MSEYINSHQKLPVVPSSIDTLRQNYRRALISVGKSPDYHIFDLSSDFINGLKDSKAKRFLLTLKLHFSSLDPKDKQLFVLDILETGRHYPFWYLEDYTRRAYEARLRQLIAEVPSCLKRRA